MDQFKDTIRNASLLSGVTTFGKEKLDKLLNELAEDWELKYKHEYSRPENIRIVFFNSDKVSSVHTSLLQLAKEKGKGEVYATLFDSEIRRVIPIDAHLLYERDILLRKPKPRKMHKPQPQAPVVKQSKEVARIIPPVKKQETVEPIQTAEPTLMQSRLQERDIDALIKISQDMDIED